MKAARCGLCGDTAPVRATPAPAPAVTPGAGCGSSSTDPSSRRDPKACCGAGGKDLPAPVPAPAAIFMGEPGPGGIVSVDGPSAAVTKEEEGLYVLPIVPKVSNRVMPPLFFTSTFNIFFALEIVGKSKKFWYGSVTASLARSLPTACFSSAAACATARSFSFFLALFMALFWGNISRSL